MRTRYRNDLWQTIKDFISAPFHSPNTRYIKYLRRLGVKVGKGVLFRDAKSATIDLTRPSLIEIGDNVDINVNFTIMTHDFASGVFLNKHQELVNSSGSVKLGNNIYIGRDVTILKGASVGDNCVIGLGSVVTSHIPSNSVAVGIPAKVICSIDEYYERRKSRCLEEAFEYARSIRKNFNREPEPEDFWEEFPHFVSGDKVEEYPMIPIRKQLGGAYDHYCKHHKATFGSFEEFLNAAFEQKTD
jgi:acetyltransferase-like isoleucine patch superfamily enzyme